MSHMGQTIRPEISGHWINLNEMVTCPYEFIATRSFMEKRLNRSPRQVQQEYKVSLYVNHSMSHIHEEKSQIDVGKTGECGLLSVGSKKHSKCGLLSLGSAEHASGPVWQG